MDNCDDILLYLAHGDGYMNLCMRQITHTQTHTHTNTFRTSEIRIKSMEYIDVIS